MKILMVCLGNICRSPIAEGLLRSKIETNELDWIVDSAGTGSWHSGESPDSRSIQIALKNGLDISDQTARHFLPGDLDDFDLIYAMDMSNYNNIIRYAKTPEQEAKVKLILDEIYPGEHKNVPDPYYGGKDGFQTVYNMLDEATDAILHRLIGE